MIQVKSASLYRKGSSKANTCEAFAANPHRQRAHEPAGGQFRIDHGRSAERDAEPVDCR
jgi:hypothetical protein